MVNNSNQYQQNQQPPLTSIHSTQRKKPPLTSITSYLNSFNTKKKNPTYYIENLGVGVGTGTKML
jgi:hypothetical protein